MPFQTSALTFALCGSLHTFRALIGWCYANTAFSFLAPIVALYFAFVTQLQCGLPYVLCPACRVAVL